MEAAAVSFKSYDSFENYYSRDQVAFIENHKSEELWVGTEKIHGTNFSFVCDGEDVTCAKRTSLLTQKDKFYNFQSITKPYISKVKELYQLVQKEIYPNLQVMRVFGELYGGHYPGVESKCKAIQTGVYYCNELAFEAFDIFVELSNGDRFYCDYKQVTEFFKRVEIPYAEILIEGTLQELLEKLTADNAIDEFQSTIYLKHGLPKLEINSAEGYVIKQNITESNDGEFERHSIKVKSKKFKESEEIKVVKKEPKKKGTLSAEQEAERDEIVARAVAYINKNRFDGIISKLTEDERTKKTVKGMLVQDAVKDFNKEEPEDIVTKSKKYKGVMMPAISEAALKLIDEHMPAEE